MYDIIKMNEGHPSLEFSLKRQFTEYQRLLIDLIVENEEKKQGASFSSLAVRAGYGDGTNREASRTTDTNALQKAYVQDALEELLNLTLGMGTFRATT